METQKCKDYIIIKASDKKGYFWAFPYFFHKICCGPLLELSR